MDFLRNTSSPESSPSPRMISPRPASSGHDSISTSSRVAFDPPNRSNSPRVKFSVTSSGKIFRRMSSPPPPPARGPQFEHRVSFDLRDEDYGGAPSFGKSFTYEGYMPRSNARVYMCGTDNSDYANYALEYTIHHLMDDGDRLICVRAVQKDSTLGKKILADQNRYADMAATVIDQIKRMLKENKGPAISVKIDTVVGSVGPLLIKNMVELHSPMSIVIGTKGTSSAKKQLGVGKSISEYLYKYSPVPLIIVRPPAKRQAKFQKRQESRTRERYSNPIGDNMFDSQGRVSPVPAPEASAEEAQLVREAMKADNFDFPSLRYQLHNKVSKRIRRLTYNDIEGYTPDSDTDDILSAPPSRTASPVGHAFEKVPIPTVGDNVPPEEAAARGSQDTVEDEDFGETLGQTSSRGSILQRKQFHEMPNYDARVDKLMDKLGKNHADGISQSSVKRRPSIKWKDQLPTRARDEGNHRTSDSKDDLIYANKLSENTSACGRRGSTNHQNGTASVENGPQPVNPGEYCRDLSDQDHMREQRHEVSRTLSGLASEKPEAIKTSDPGGVATSENPYSTPDAALSHQAASQQVQGQERPSDDTQPDSAQYDDSHSSSRPEVSLPESTTSISASYGDEANVTTVSQDSTGSGEIGDKAPSVLANGSKTASQG